MLKRRRLIPVVSAVCSTLLTLVLAGCGQPPVSTPQASTAPAKYLRKLDLPLDLDSGSSASLNNVSRASFPGYSVYQITRVLVPFRFYDDSVTQRRYTSVTYELKNLTNAPLNGSGKLRIYAKWSDDGLRRRMAGW